MKSQTETKGDTTVAARVAGEDIQPGDFVAVLYEVAEYPSFLWCCSAVSLEEREPVRVRYLPRNAGEPLRVMAVCLPFVYVQNVKGNVAGIDIRQHELVRLDPKVGRRLWRQLTKPSKKKKRK